MWVLPWASHLNRPSGRSLRVEWRHLCSALLTGLSLGSNEIIQLNSPFQLAESSWIIFSSLLPQATCTGSSAWTSPRSSATRAARCWYGGICYYLQVPICPRHCASILYTQSHFRHNYHRRQVLFIYFKKIFRNEMREVKWLEQCQKPLSGMMDFHLWSAGHWSLCSFYFPTLLLRA